MKQGGMKMGRNLIVAFAITLLLALAVSIPALAERTGSGTEADPWLISEAADFGGYSASTQSSKSSWYVLESGTYTLAQDVNIDGYLYVGQYKNVIIDLNGYTLQQTGTAENSRVINIYSYGSLTLRDSSSNNSGRITGGHTSNCNSGAGIIVSGTFVMEGGTITENNSTTNGGGIRVNGGTFTMTGGVITGNRVVGSGKGVYVDLLSDSSINISGGAVIEDEVYLESDKKINVTGSLDEGVSIPVSMETPGVFSSGLSGHGSAANFVSSRPIGLNGDGEAMLLCDVNIGSFQHGTVAADRDPAQYGVGETVTLTVIPDPDYQMQSLSLSDGASLNADHTFIMPAGDVTVSAVFEEAPRETWSEDFLAIETATIPVGVSVTQNLTLTLGEGVTLTVNRGIKITEGCTLIVDGSGELVVYGANGANGTDGRRGDRISERISGGSGDDGQPAIEGNLSVHGGMIRLYGGNGGTGGNGGYNSAYKGGNGGFGGNGGEGISGTLTIDGGTVSISGGSGGEGGAGGKGKKRSYNGSKGLNGRSGSAVSGSVEYGSNVIVKESESGSYFYPISGNTSYMRYIESYMKELYDIILPENLPGGTVMASVNGEPVAKAYEGESITLTATANENYQFAVFTVTCDGLEVVTEQQDEKACTFSMPAGDVTVIAEFTAVPNINTIQGLSIWLDGENIEYGSPVYPYTREAVEPDVTMYYYDEEGHHLTEGTDFTVAYDDNTGSASEVTEATATITGIGNYAGTMTVTFRISPLTLVGATVELPDQSLQVKDDWTTDYIFYKLEAANYDEKIAESVGVVVTDRNGNVLIPGIDYKFGSVTSLRENGEGNQIGEECVVEIDGAGDYTGSTTAQFKIKAPVKDGLWGEDIAWDFDNGVLTLWGEEGAVMQRADSYSDYPWYTVSSYVTSIDIQEGVTSIADMAFGGDQNINSYGNVHHITVSPDVKTIGEDAFAYMTGLHTFDSLEHVTSIGSCAFNQCRMLTAYVPATVTGIGSGAFGGCTLVFYEVSVAETEGGTVSVSVPEHEQRPQTLSGDIIAAVEDAAVAITLHPAPGYMPEALTVTNLEGTPLTVTEGSFAMPSSPVCVTATFSAIDYTITAAFEHATLWLNEAEVPDLTQPVTAHVGDSVRIVPDEGYALDTVTVTNADDIAVETVNGEFTMPADSVFVTAALKQRFTVAFDADGGTGTMDSLAVDSGESFILPTATVFTAPEGKTFREWSVKIGEADAAVMDPGAEITVTGNTLITAVWQDALPEFSTPDFTMPASLTVIEESAFEGMTNMTVVDAQNCKTIGKNAFKDCTNLTQIKLPADCAIDPTAFDHTVYVFAPDGGTTKQCCDAQDHLIFVETN